MKYSTNSRQRKDGRYVNFYMDHMLFDRLEQYCRETGMTKTATIAYALSDLLDQFVEKPKRLKRLLPKSKD